VYWHCKHNYVQNEIEYAGCNKTWIAIQAFAVLYGVPDFASWDAGENLREYAWDVEPNIHNNVRDAAVVENPSRATRRGEDLDPVEENADFEE